MPHMEKVGRGIVIHAAKGKFFRQTVFIVLAIVCLLTLSLPAKAATSFPPSDSTGQTAYSDTIQQRYVDLIRIIDVSTDSVINHIQKIDSSYSQKLAVVHDSLSSLIPASAEFHFRDSLATVYSGFLQAMSQNRQTWADAVGHFRETVLPVISTAKNKLNYSADASDEDYSFGLSLFSNFADSMYQSVKDSIADYSDNASASMNNLFATLRDSLQGLTGGYLQMAGEEAPHQESVLPQESAPGLPPFSLYASFSGRYDRNPLCNYQKVGDFLWQSYHELKYLSPAPSGLLSVKYIGGLTLFNTLADRNYYESMLTGKYRIIFGQHDGSVSDDAADDSFEKFNSLNISVAAGARFDKQVYHDYNNHGLVLAVTFKKPLTDSLFVTLKNTFCSRKYEWSSELSNNMELLSAGVSGKLGGNFSYDLTLQGGIKEYHETLIDTIITGYADISGTQPIISLVAQPEQTYHSSVNLHVMKSWEASSLQFTFGYTTNFNSKARFLRKNIDKPRLTEDIYYDYFSYTGEDVRLEYQGLIPFNIRMNVSAELHVNELYLPAFTLAGIKTAENRHDILSGLSASFSRYFDSGLGFGYELNLSGGFVRRMSKDDYNDFSSYFTSAGISVGF